MDRATLRRELRAIASSLLELDDFADDAHFVRDLRADSMLLAELAATVERSYQIKLPESELRDVRSLDDVLRLVAPLLGAG